MSLSRAAVKVTNLGRMGYQQAFGFQKKCLRQHLDSLAGNSESGNHNTLFIVEHNPVYTIGIRTQGYTEEDEAYLKSLGAEFHKTNRGGLITFHGPGQLVAYPVINMKDFRVGMKGYICKLERTVIGVCRNFGITAGTSLSDPGVWVEDRKIAAVGVHGTRYITTHGLSLNCNTDLMWFEHIVSCGIEDKGVTSLTKETGREITIEETLSHFLDSFSEEFKCDLKTDQLSEI